jgi:ribosome-associated toxin RatA of RatAB toxin-antitoxin module
MHSTIGIDVAAPPDVVYRVARDVTRWERMLPHYSRSRVIRREPDGVLVCDFVARRPLVPVLGLGLPVTWRSRTWHDPATRRLRFIHVGGATKGMDVTWTIEPAPAGTRIEIAHDFRRRLPIPVLGALLGDALFPAFVDRFFTRPIAGRTLATVKALAEALAPEIEIEPSPSETAAGTNP